MRYLRAAALALVLGLASGCSSLPLPGGGRLESPIPAAASLEIQAYGVLQTYAAVLEEAGDLVRRPQTPTRLVETLARAEALATPAVEAVAIALTEYLRARAELESTPGEGAARTAAVAGAALAQALARAQEPLGALRRAIS